MQYSRFQRLDDTPVESEKPAIDWFQEAEDDKFRLSLRQTRAELSAALRYKQAFEMVYQEIESICENHELPLVKERRLIACLKSVRKNFPELI